MSMKKKLNIEHGGRFGTFFWFNFVFFSFELWIIIPRWRRFYKCFLTFGGDKKQTNEYFMQKVFFGDKKLTVFISIIWINREKFPLALVGSFKNSCHSLSMSHSLSCLFPSLLSRKCNYADMFLTKQFAEICGFINMQSFYRVITICWYFNLVGVVLAWQDSIDKWGERISNVIRLG